MEVRGATTERRGGSESSRSRLASVHHPQLQGRQQSSDMKHYPAHLELVVTSQLPDLMAKLCDEVMSTQLSGLGGRLP